MQLNGRSRDSALYVFCAAVVCCAGTNLAVAAGTQRASEYLPVDGGSIVGVVVNERHEPIGRATVQAFPALATAPQAPGRQNLPPLMRASGSASTNDEGRFRISRLEPGEYLVAAEPVSLLSGDGRRRRRSTRPRFFRPPSTTSGPYGCPSPRVWKRPFRSSLSEFEGCGCPALS